MKSHNAAWPGVAIGALSAAALSFLFYLLYGRTSGSEAGRFTFLPAVNAACNAVTTVLIVHGLVVIHRGDERRHRRSMLGAFASSTLFLVGYVVYHIYHGDSRFPGQGWIRPVYFTILISHIMLSAAALPLVLTTFYLALARRLEAHKKVARFTYPIWLYVSVTGVTIFFLLRAYSS
jgi:putative membrane protein